MKKFLILCAASLIAMTACNKTEPTAPQTENAPKAIQFNTYLSRTTKAAIADAALLQTTGFYVAASLEGQTEPYFKATPTKYDNSVSVNTGVAGFFVPTPARYWPFDFDSNTDKLTFYAANYANVTADGTIAYKTNTNSSKSTDLVVAYKVETAKILNDDNGPDYVADANKKKGCVDLDFEHALVKVNFTLKGLDNDLDGGYQYNIESLTVCGIDTEGTYTIEHTAADKSTYKPGAWSGVTTSADLEYCSGVAFTYDKTETKLTNYDTDKYGFVMGTATGKNNLVVIPQKGNWKEVTPATDPKTYTAADADDTEALIKCNIKYSVKDENDNLLADYSSTSSIVANQGGRDFYIPVNVTYNYNTGKWTEQGKAFRYIIEIPAGIQPITFAAKVGKWDEELISNITL